MFARARPQRVAIKEKYRYFQEISVDRTIRPGTERGDAARIGRIDVVVPYDGHRFFSRDAVDDVQWQLGPSASSGPMTSTIHALVGHLVFAEVKDATREDGHPLAGVHGAVALRVPVRARHLRDGDLSADQQESALRIGYHPPDSGNHPLPVTLTAEVLDPEDDPLPTGGAVIDAESWADPATAARIMRQPAFSSALRLALRVDVLWPQHSAAAPAARVKKITLQWPAPASLDADSLTAYVGPEPTAMQYKAEDATLECVAIPLERVGDDETGRAPDHDDRHDDRGVDDSAVWALRSPVLTLAVEQPGQLSGHQALDGELEVEVDGELLSGIDARLFDATGARVEGVLAKKTSLVLGFRLLLGDVFGQRDVSATHTLHFDEVVPDRQRLDDILSALRDRGFTTTERVLDESEDNPQWIVRASRSEGPDRILLLLVVQGRRHVTRRLAETPGWHSYSSRLYSGEIRVTMYGRVPRDSRELVTEVNELRQSLSTRFRHVQAQR